MKKLFPRTIFVFIIGIIFVLINTALDFNMVPPQGATFTATPIQTPTLTKAELALEVGSTDGIFVWALIITLIIVIPILWHRFHWGRIKTE